MAIDFRVRPPYGEGKNQVLFKGLIPPNNRLDEAPLMIGRRRVASAIAGSVDQMVQEMDIAGIDVGVLMGRKTNNPVYGNADTNELFELSEKYPGRFVVFAGIHPQEKDWREQLESAAARGARGIAVDSGWWVDAVRCDDPMLMPVYKACEEKGLIASVTSSIYLGRDVSYSDPAAIQRISNACPNLKIVVPHACWPHTPQILGVALICPNVYLMPDLYFYNKHIPLADAIADAANGYLMKQLLFASSYPCSTFQQAREGWEARPLSREALLHSMHYNAARLLGL